MKKLLGLTVDAIFFKEKISAILFITLSTLVLGSSTAQCMVYQDVLEIKQLAEETANSWAIWKYNYSTSITSISDQLNIRMPATQQTQIFKSLLKQTTAVKEKIEKDLETFFTPTKLLIATIGLAAFSAYCINQTLEPISKFGLSYYESMKFVYDWKLSPDTIGGKFLIEREEKKLNELAKTELTKAMTYIIPGLLSALGALVSGTSGMVKSLCRWPSKIALNKLDDLIIRTQPYCN